MAAAAADRGSEEAAGVTAADVIGNNSDGPTVLALTTLEEQRETTRLLFDAAAHEATSPGGQYILFLTLSQEWLDSCIPADLAAHHVGANRLEIMYYGEPSRLTLVLASLHLAPHQHSVVILDNLGASFGISDTAEVDFARMLALAVEVCAPDARRLVVSSTVVASTHRRQCARCFHTLYTPSGKCRYLRQE